MDSTWEAFPAGGKLWTWRYRFAGKDKRLALGRYPHVTLTEARKQRDSAHGVLAGGDDPGELREQKKAARQAAAEISPRRAA